MFALDSRQKKGALANKIFIPLVILIAAAFRCCGYVSGSEKESASGEFLVNECLVQMYVVQAP